MYFTVFLMICVVFGVDQECQVESSDLISCYHCLNKDEWCSDPFNDTHPQLETIDCDGMCVKWVREPAPGKITFIRTCSTRLKILMNIYHVCMRESRPAKGQICFCNTPHCNMAPHTLKMSSTALIFTCLLISLVFAGDSTTNLDGLVPGSLFLCSSTCKRKKLQHVQNTLSLKSQKHLSTTYH